jgi:hypothetical protein
MGGGGAEMGQVWNITIEIEDDLSSDQLIEEIEFYVGEVLGISQVSGEKVPNAE